MMQLDEIDIEILKCLQEDSTITHKELANRLNLSTTPIFERIKKLNKNGIIKKYVALVDNKQIDKAMVVFVFIQSKEHSFPKIRDMYDAMEAIPEVMECYHIGGDHDYLIKVIVKDMEEYEHFMLTKLSTIGNIAHLRSTFVISKIKHTTAVHIGN